MSSRQPRLRPEDGATRVRAEDGATTVEYGILAAVVGVVLVATGPMLAEAFLDLLGQITGGMLGE